MQEHTQTESPPAPVDLPARAAVHRPGGGAQLYVQWRGQRGPGGTQLLSLRGGGSQSQRLVLIHVKPTTSFLWFGILHNI